MKNIHSSIGRLRMDKSSVYFVLNHQTPIEVKYASHRIKGIVVKVIANIVLFQVKLNFNF
jgi:hypothetical protein